MAPDSSSPPAKPDLQQELEQKLADIGAKEQVLASQQLATQLGVPYADLKGLPVDSGALKRIPEAEARAANTVLVQAKGDTAVMVVLDPRTAETKAVIDRFAKEFPKLTVLIVSPQTMTAVLKRYEGVKVTEVFERGAITVDEATLSRLSGGIKNINDLRNELGSATVTELFEVLIAGALATKASDLHFEPG